MSPHRVLERRVTARKTRTCADTPHPIHPGQRYVRVTLLPGYDPEDDTPHPQTLAICGTCCR
jgi:hypothetical protein